LSRQHGGARARERERHRERGKERERERKRESFERESVREHENERASGREIDRETEREADHARPRVPPSSVPARPRTTKCQRADFPKHEKYCNALQVLEAEHSSNLLALLPDVLLDKVTTKNNLAAQHRHCGSLLSHSVHPLAFPDAEKHLKQALKIYR